MLGQSSDYLKPFENNFRVRCIRKLLRKILPCPMLIMLSHPPHFGTRHIVHDALVCNPDFRLVLPVTKRQLRAGYGAELLGIVNQNFLTWQS